jgi:hypothetical protein
LPGTTAGAPLLPPDDDLLYLGVLASVVSLAMFFHFFRHGEILLYGDATAHIHIARRVFDSRTPGLAQLGTVWLPLPHLLMLPFLVNNWAWQSGAGGSIPSMIAYVAGVIGIFRLVRGWLPPNPNGRIAAWLAALIYGANPNSLYLQSTAMTETICLALFVWATVYFSEFVQVTRRTGALAKAKCSRALYRCGLTLAAGMLTRYDGWFAAPVFAVAAFAVSWKWTGGRVPLWHSPLRPAFIRFLVLVAVVPTFWLGYNAILWGHPLEFATGPYSARALEAKADRPGGWHYPGWHSPKVAAVFFLKSAKLNMAGGLAQRETPETAARRWRLENGWLPVTVLGTALLLIFERGWWPCLLLWLPLPFYSLSLAWGGVPIFLPSWWPYSYYNVRYGLQLLPAFAVFAVLTMYFAARLGKRSGWRIAPPLLLLALVAGSYVVVWRAVPICLREAQTNSRGRILFDQTLGRALRRLPPDSTVLMYTARHAAALEFAAFPLRRTINETNNKLWRAALAAPAQAAEYVVAFDTPDDPVRQSVQQHADELQLLAVFTSPTEPRALLYRRR